MSETAVQTSPSKTISRRTFMGQLGAGLAAAALGTTGFRFEQPPIQANEAEKLKNAGLSAWTEVYGLSRQFTTKYGVSPFSKIAEILQEVVDGKKAANSNEVIALKSGWYEGDEAQQKMKAVESAKEHIATRTYKGANPEEMKASLNDMASIYPLQALSAPKVIEIIPNTGGMIHYLEDWVKLASPVTNPKEAAFVANFHELTHGFEFIFETLNTQDLNRLKAVMRQQDAAALIASKLSVYHEALNVWLQSPWEMASEMKYGDPLFQAAALPTGTSIEELEGTFGVPGEGPYKPRQDKKGNQGYRLSRVIHFVGNNLEASKNNRHYKELMKNALYELQHFFVGPPQGKEVGTWPQQPGDLTPGLLSELNLMLHIDITNGTSTLSKDPTLLEIATALHIDRADVNERKKKEAKAAPMTGEVQKMYRQLTSYGAKVFGNGERYKLREGQGYSQEYNVFELPDNKEDPNRKYLLFLFSEPLETWVKAGDNATTKENHRGVIVSVPRDMYNENIITDHHASEITTGNDGNLHFRFQLEGDKWIELTKPRLGGMEPSTRWHNDNNQISTTPVIAPLKELSSNQIMVVEAPITLKGGVGEMNKSSGNVVAYINNWGRSQEFPAGKRRGFTWMPYATPSMLTTDDYSGRGFAILKDNNKFETLLEGSLPRELDSYLINTTLTTMEEKDSYILRCPTTKGDISLKMKLMMDDETRESWNRFLQAREAKPNDNYLFLQRHIASHRIVYEISYAGENEDQSFPIPLKNILWA